MTASIIDNFADLGAALKQLEDSKAPAAADVPAPVNNYTAPNWASIYGAATAPVDYMGYEMVSVAVVGQLGQ